MAYNYITKYDSPNYTPASQVAGAWSIGNRSIEGITLHWWGDPNQNPTFENVVNYLCRSNGNTSAHYVATGTNRKVACIVSPYDAAWHAGSSWGNVHTIGIECDPRARDEDYDVVAELVADLRSEFGDVPIYWHSYFTSTACPGAWDPYRVDELSYTKFSASNYGEGGNKVETPAPTPVPVPAPTPAPVPQVVVKKQVTYDAPKEFKIISDTILMNIPDGTKYAKSKNYVAGEIVKDVVEMFEYSNGKIFYRTKYARDTAKKMYGFDAAALVEIVPEKPSPVVTEPSPTTKDPVTGQPLPDTGKDVVSKDDYEATKARVSALESLVKMIMDFLSSIFKGFNK